MVHKLLVYYKYQRFFPGLISILINLYSFFSFVLFITHKKSTKTIKSRGLQDTALDCFISPHQPPADASHSPAGDQCVA